MGKLYKPVNPLAQCLRSINQTRTTPLDGPEVLDCLIAMKIKQMIAEVLDDGKMACHMGAFIYLLTMPALCSQWMIGSNYRRKLRNKFGLLEAPYTYIISHIFCSCCSLCQEFRELKIRELDPAIGWKGILAKQQHEDQAVEAPPQTQAMSK